MSQAAPSLIFWTSLRYWRAKSLSFALASWARHPIQRAHRRRRRTVSRDAWKLGLDGIVSKRTDSSIVLAGLNEERQHPRANGKQKRIGANDSDDRNRRGRAFDVVADGVVVGRVFKLNAAPVGAPWIWRLATREGTIATFARRWRH
jgi:hypothetical protein